MDPANQVDRLQERLHALRSLTGQGSATVSLCDLEALAAALEQVQLAEIEMRHQNTELAAARTALEAERSRYRDLFEMAPDAYLITNEHGLVTEANRAAGMLLKVERKFLIGKPLQVFIPPSERGRFRARVIEAHDEDAPLEWRMQVTPRDGGAIVVAATVARLSDRRSPGGLRWALRDITSQARDEERLRDINAELERRVVERTAALEAANRAKDELLVRERAARDAAEEANRSKDEFLATISHELRTPLNVVLGWTYRMRSHTLDREQSEKAVEIIDRNARQQLHLVEELLDSARIATGRFELELQLEELGPLLQTAIDSLEATAATRNITLTSALDAGVYVRVDAGRIRQIAWNLLSNALKFTPEGGRVHISLTTADQHAVLGVTDTGIGISAPGLCLVFEPFWQADPSTRRARSGLGLGLAIVKHLVELHGGDVSATSNGQGEGATFTVRLPLPSDAAPGTSAAAEG
jgi:PAS domain S-box-containing protein